MTDFDLERLRRLRSGGPGVLPRRSCSSSSSLLWPWLMALSSPPSSPNVTAGIIEEPFAAADCVASAPEAAPTVAPAGAFAASAVAASGTAGTLERNNADVGKGFTVNGCVTLGAEAAGTLERADVGKGFTGNGNGCVTLGAEAVADTDAGGGLGGIFIGSGNRLTAGG